jgi:hypothetical protein
MQPLDIESFILQEYGITSKVILLEGKPAIKVDHHFSLFTLIQKIRRHFDFIVHHTKSNNEYILYIGAKH